MNTRITIDLKDEKLFSLIRLEAARQMTSIREIVVEALTHYFADRVETATLAKLAENAFAEWDNPEDAAYDHL